MTTPRHPDVTRLLREKRMAKAKLGKIIDPPKQPTKRGRQKRRRFNHKRGWLEETYGKDVITRAFEFERKARNLASQYYRVDELPRYKVIETQI